MCYGVTGCLHHCKQHECISKTCGYFLNLHNARYNIFMAINVHRAYMLVLMCSFTQIDSLA